MTSRDVATEQKQQIVRCERGNRCAFPDCGCIRSMVPFARSESAPKLCPDCGCELECVKHGCAKKYAEHRNSVLEEAAKHIEGAPVASATAQAQNERCATSIRALKNAPTHSPASEVAAPTPAPSEPGNAGLATSRSAASGAPSAASPAAVVVGDTVFDTEGNQHVSDTQRCVGATQMDGYCPHCGADPMSRCIPPRDYTQCSFYKKRVAEREQP